VISRNKNSSNLKSSKVIEEDEDDILGGITLLKISKASRERDISLKNSLSNSIQSSVNIRIRRFSIK
jgi:hypothetical protein